MRVKISNIDEINKILRSTILSLTGLDGKKVVNGYTIHGQELETQLNKYVANSYKPEDVYILFELQPRDEYVTETNYNNDLTINSAYRMRLYVYGNNSTTIVNKIISKMLTDMNRLDLQNQGIYLENISNIMNGTDFLNDTLFPRTDLDINIYCEMEVLQDDIGEITEMSGPIKIIKEEDNGKYTTNSK